MQVLPHALPPLTVTSLAQRLNFWVFVVGFFLVIVGSSYSLTFVIQGSVASGSHTTVSLGALLAVFGATLMAVCYVTDRK